MEQPFVINFPVSRSGRKETPLSDIAEMREMFREMNHRYMVYEPPAFYSFLKRAMDMSAALIFIVLFMSWILPIVAILIKLSSRGPVFFVQKRTGHKGREFDCLKFRTMVVNDKANTHQAVKGDKRITPIGRFLRKTHLDETPQFFNVLMGDMSIVGPRPHMLFHTDYYAGLIPYYNLRHEATPGMTGMAQIKGYIGEINEERELRKRVQWDIYYLKNRNIWMDINIVFTTFAQVIGKGLSGLFRREKAKSVA